MKDPSPRSREHVRTVERLVALAEAYGCSELDSLRADIEVVIRVEYLTFARSIRSTDERWRRRMTRGSKMPTGTRG